MTESDRDRSVERQLRRSLRSRSESSDATACLDAETLAAWADGGLTAPQATVAMAHLADCPRCQAMVAAIGRSLSPMPQAERWWRRHWGLGFAVPLTAAAAAVVLWVAVPRVNPPTSQPRATIAEPAEPTQVQVEARTAPSDRVDAPAAPARAQEQLLGRDRPPAEAPGQFRNEVVGRVEKAEDAKEAQTPAAVVGAAARARAAAPTSAAESLAATGDRAALMARQSADVRIIASPDPRILWRILVAGTIQYSANGGAAWEDVETGAASPMTAGVAPSSTVCWLVGVRGTVLRTSDGRRWQRVIFPDTVDLTGVQATDAQTARVTAADGRVFRTADGGTTWDLAPLQEF